NNKEVQRRLRNYILLRVPPSYEYKGKRLLAYDAFEDMAGASGFAVASLHDDKLASHNKLISAHPFVSSRYSWAPDYGVREVKTILDLPREATITQRSMIYAISVHPERPRSIEGRGHWAFLGHAERHSARQASMHNQHHADLIGAIGRMGGEMG